MANTPRKYPYYKVQYWDELSICWRDIQESHASIKRARKAAELQMLHKYRVMQVERNKRAPAYTHNGI